jgi:hypothetical protein
MTHKLIQCHRQNFLSPKLILKKSEHATARREHLECYSKSVIQSGCLILCTTPNEIEKQFDQEGAFYEA